MIAPSAGAFARLDGADLALALALELVELRLVGADDLHDLDADRGGVDLDVLGDRGQLAQERLGDLAVGRDDDFADLAVDDVERDLFAEEDVGEGLGETLAQLVHLGLVLFLDLLDLAAAIGGREAFSCSLSMREETLTSMMMPATPDGTTSDVSFTSAAFSPKMARRSFSSGRQLGLGLGGDLADEDVAGLHFRADADDAVVVEVLQRFLADVRDVARDFFRPELGVAGGDLELLDVDRGEDVLLEDLLGDEDRVLEVVAVPGHERRRARCGPGPSRPCRSRGRRR